MIVFGSIVNWIDFKRKIKLAGDLTVEQTLSVLFVDDDVRNCKVRGVKVCSNGNVIRVIWFDHEGKVQHDNYRGASIANAWLNTTGWGSAKRPSFNVPDTYWLPDLDLTEPAPVDQPCV